ncbi:hypothetical protein JTB14_021678 [Gonioctena quinquepunctata]|nr:hypothetical protein JTB14_021678 [Gonioctena quinquepunctata]
MNIMTRSQNRKPNNNQQENFNESPNDRLDHPGIVELLKAPKDFVQIHPLENDQFEKIKKNECIKIGNILYDEKANNNYLNQDNSRSTTAFRASLRELKKICQE